MRKFVNVLIAVLLMVSAISVASELSMVIAVTGPFQRNFNPYFAGATGYIAAGFIYETLIYSNTKTGELIPWLASEYEWSPDLKEITFKLRKNVTWSDGMPLTAEDVVFTFETLRKFPALDSPGVWKGGVTNVQKLDEYTVKITLEKVNTFIIYSIAGVYILPKHLWEKVEDPSKFTNENPVGTGAYLLDSFSDQVVVLKKNPNYWNADKVKVEKIRIPAFSGNESAQLAVARGELDWAGINYPQIERLAQQNKDIKYWFAEGNPVFLFFNLSKKPFDDVVLRKAFAHAIDTDQLVKIGMTGYAAPVNPVVIKSGYEYLIVEDLKNLWWKHDPKTAERLFQQAGFKKGKDGILAKDETKLSFDLLVPAGWTDWIAVCELLSQQLRDYGVELKVTPVDFGQYLQKIRNKDFDVVLSWANYGPTVYHFYDNFMNSNNAFVGSNRGGWIDERTDELLAKMKQTSSLDELKSIIAELQKIVLENVPAVPLYYNPVWFIYSTKNFTGWPSEKNPYVEPRITGMDKIYLVMHLEPVK
ncbi:MAG: Extracellular solute-binding protein family 5 [Thermotoga sp. 50_1627]|nr:MAG: Extracellular solute-binding protein family 5 [Thermotoga sp. 50_64]KUK24356.1 MAG: Extracellular solute-binding protein family 5 [Thermotoga sp. 50_1627]HBT39078.1 ABC transporter substrate-binding protein [Pseudothermotoga sp.]HCO98355.1 ABC transporter substrate-binding protein [Pseudothermotoga sp.]